MGLFSTANQVGLYIDMETICVVNSQITGQGAKVVGFSELKSQNILDGPPDMKQRVVDNIRLALKQASVSSKSLCLAIPGDGSMTRHFELPNLPKKEERGAVRFEAQKYVPFDMKDLYHDYETYPDTERKKAAVVFFACKKQWVDSLSALLQLAGIRISQVELVSQSIARAFYRHSAKGSEEVCAIFAANSSQTAELVIQKNGAVLTTQHLSLSAPSLAAQLDTAAIVSDIRISMDYFSDNFRKLKIARFYLATPFPGDTQSFSQTLKSEFSIPVDTGQLFKPPTSFSSTAASIAAYGLTLSALEKRGARRINLKGVEATTAGPVAAVSWEEEKKKLQELVIMEMLGLVVLFAAAYFVLSGIAGGKRAELAKATMNYPQAQSASISEPIQQLQSKEMQAQVKIAYLTELLDKRVYFTGKMNELAKLVPPTLQIQRFNLSDDLSPKGTSALVIRMIGQVTSAETGGELSIINKFVAQLTQSKEFMAGIDEIKIVSTQRVTGGAVPAMKFTLECTTKKV